MRDQEQETGGPGSAVPEGAPRPLDGFTVAVTAARKAAELGALLERRGAEVVYAPALRTVPLADDAELRAVTRALVAGPPDAVVASTAVGFRGWLAAADDWGLGEALRGRLAGAELLARGPKVRGAIRAAGLTERWSPASESLAGVLDHLLAEGVAGRRIAVQLHGEPQPEFVGALRAAGADVVPVPVYRWLPPVDLGPLDGLLDAVLARGVDAVTFTSAPAVTSLLRRAAERGIRPGLLAALRRDVPAVCVGPVTAAPLAALDVPTLEPERFRLGPLVQLLCRELPLRARPLAVAGRRLEVRARTAVVDGAPRPVPPAGMALLRTLARRPGEAVPRADLLRALPGPAGGGRATEADLEAAVAHLRAALGESGLIHPAPGGGYRLAPDAPTGDAPPGVG
ncbi:uroporphyrinogen-III synthase [Streptomyces sp. NPDC056149]|uniref:uroporphyrinogen-III synthase n=1 Tax=unclassified Streptomyces TaxID=2593676 RepID=UPI0023810955|nr:uroporphyrinogen-III synthase [Streptomyces sp. WZ-12]